MTSNIGTALAVLAKNNNEKHVLTNSISLHGDVSSFIHNQLSKQYSTNSVIHEDEPLSTASNHGKRKIIRF